MHRRVVRPFGSSIPATRTVSLLFLLAVLWVLYQNVRDPATWHWLATRNEDPVMSDVSGTPQLAPVELEEVVVPGPNDLDPAEMAKFKEMEGLIADRNALRGREMLAYWQLMAWSRTEPFDKFEKRALREPAFTQLWEQPAQYRAKPIRLRMHVRRVLQYDAPENPLGLKVAFEAWGWTDESKSYPYTVVFANKPPELPVGPDVEGEVIFVGYFLKNMAYTAFDKRLAAPLLVGRVRMAGPVAVRAPDSSFFGGDVVTYVLSALVLAAAGWLVFASVRGKKPRASTANEACDFQWATPDTGISAFSLDSEPSSANAPVLNNFSGVIDVEPPRNQSV